MTHRSMSGSAGRQWLGQGLVLRDASDTTLNGLIVQSAREYRNAPSTADAQGHFLLLAVFGAWAGFLGLMAVVAIDETFPRIMGAVALICGFVVFVIGLYKVVRDRPGV